MLYDRKTKDEIIDELVEHEKECADDECVDDWVRNGVNLIGFNNMTDEELIEDYKMFILGE